MLNTKLEKQFNSHKLLTIVIVIYHTCYVFLHKGLWRVHIFTKWIPIKAAKFHTKEVKRVQENASITL